MSDKKEGSWEDGKKKEAGKTFDIETTVDGCKSEIVILVIL
jgi:hypothetical protein